jgi:hypothetical protein
MGKAHRLTAEGRPDRAKSWWGHATWAGRVLILGPVSIFLLITAATYARFVHTQMPAVEFYKVAAEVIPLLLLATMISGDAFTGLSSRIRGYYTVLLAAAESVALLAVSGIFVPRGGDHPLRVGGGKVVTNLMACTIGTGLVGAGLLVCWVIVGRPATRKT